jgi:hypothetical protein
MTTTTPKNLRVPLTAFVVGAVVALLVGVFGKAHDPTTSGLATIGFDTIIEMKVYVSIAIAVLAVLQLIGALWIYGKLGLAAPTWLGTAHRVAGTVTLLLMVFVAYNCLWALGLESGDGISTRVVVHGLLGCAVIGALVVKVVAVQSHSAPGWFLPVAGGLLFALVIAVVWTSAIWFVGANGWPSGPSY